MGRLRNLSESFKAAAFNHAANSTSSPALEKTDSPTPTGNNTAQELPPAARAASNTSLPQSTPPATRAGRSASRPTSMVYTPPSIESGKDMQIEELLPVFSYLSSHGNKLYQEGYFLKLNDLDTNGKPNADRNWTECFAQLVGTVLSLWDAAALDAAGQDGEVPPAFINLADASIKMIETLPTRNKDVQPLQNVLSISTAGKNRYLLHFNSLHSLTQWTAGIRLAMFEHASLHELYTGSLIAGKGKHLNNIRSIMERTKFKTEDWARVRFGAGTPWRRCWCVIDPPDEKEWQRVTKSLKKRSAYERPAFPKGDIKFYDTKKTKKALPIATITDAYSAYAIYPQSKPLIEQSTLVKVEGRITIHSNPESKTEGFVFVMPEVHPAVTGFEMMLRWLFPVYDCFHLYGRPNRLVADTLDPRGLMFAMPKERRYGYLDIIDVAALIHTDGSEKWSEREWRKQMKDVTSRRMLGAAQSRPSGNLGSRSANRNSMGSGNAVQYEDGAMVRSTPPSRQGHQPNQSTDAVFSSPQKISAGPVGPYLGTPQTQHMRSASESVAFSSPSKVRKQHKPSRLSMDQDVPPKDIQVAPVPPVHRQPVRPGQMGEAAELMDSRNSSDTELAIARTLSKAEDVSQDIGQQNPPAPVVAPPDFQHQPTDRPHRRPDAKPELRREKSRMSNATLEELVDASRMGSNSVAGAAAAAAWKQGGRNGEQPARGVNQIPTDDGISANQHAEKAMRADGIPPMGRVDAKPLSIRQSSAHSITRKPLPRSASEHSVNRQPMPTLAPPVPGIPNREHSADSLSRSKNGQDANEPPDYTSSRRPEDMKVEKVRARTGVLKTVGDRSVSENNPYGATKSDIPVIDFGVTHSLSPSTSRPSTGMGTVGRKSPFDSPSTPERRSPREGRTPENLTPDEKKAGHIGRLTPSPGHSRSSSHAWQPGTTMGRQSPGPVLTAEEYVQQKFAASRGPSGYVPQKSHSAGKVEQVAAATKKLQKKREGPTETWNAPVDYSSNLSAREQEHVARMTGGPLVKMSERSRTPDPSVGLIGAIEAREQEKRNIKDGVSGQMVQAAIAQRQYHPQTQMQQLQQPAQFPQHYGYGQNGQWTGQQQQAYQGVPPQGQWQGQQYQQAQWQNQQPRPNPQQMSFQQHQQHQQQWQNQQKYGGFYR